MFGVELVRDGDFAAEGCGERWEEEWVGVVGKRKFVWGSLDVDDE